MGEVGMAIQQNLYNCMVCLIRPDLINNAWYTNNDWYNLLI